MSREEHAAGVRGAGSYPAAWGPPHGRSDSEERVAWVRECVLRHSRSPEVALRRLAARDEALLSALRLLEIEAKKKGPGQ